MFAITKLDKSGQDHVSFLNSDGNGKSNAATIAISRVVASRLGLPTGEIEVFDQFYRSTWKVEVDRTLCQLNELFLIDLELCHEYVQKFYRLRYVMMNPKKSLFMPKQETALQDFLGLGDVLDAVTVSVIQTQHTRVMNFHTAVSNILEQLSDNKQ